MTHIIVVVAIIVIIAILLKILTKSIKWAIRFAINAVLGVGLLYLLNHIPHVNVTINFWSVVITGIFGVPAAIVLLIISFFR